MFTSETLPFRDSGVLNTLVSDYLDRQEQLIPFYNEYPDVKGFENILQKNPYQNFDRKNLVNLLSAQAGLVSNTSERSLHHIQLLSEANTFTVTTGHQLCLFTGPLYFIYKIISTINLAKQLNQLHKGHRFVPVYWMASEDHDFEEVNHFYSAGKKIHWNSDQHGAVGEFDPTALKELEKEWKSLFGISERSKRLTGLFENAYLKHRTLADATRYLVNELFGEKGIIIIDGNDTGFKHQFKKQFTDDLFENKANTEVLATNRQLQTLGYSIQVNPRNINCFYMEKGMRSRIERDGPDFKVVQTSLRFSESEMRQMIDEHPEKLSPNVVLRPLYQQVILPNLAYVGGPGELAYWLEFYSFFMRSGVLFPVLMPRNFVMFVDKHTKGKSEKLHLSTADLFRSELDLTKLIQVQKNAVFNHSPELKQISELFLSLKQKVMAIDSTLEGSAAAEEKRALNGLERLSKKANSALRRGSETEIRQLKEIKEKLFPGAVPQERHENFSSLYLNYGDMFFEYLFETLNPFVLEQFVIKEKTEAHH